LSAYDIDHHLPKNIKMDKKSLRPVITEFYLITSPLDMQYWASTTKNIYDQASQPSRGFHA